MVEELKARALDVQEREKVYCKSIERMETTIKKGLVEKYTEESKKLFETGREIAELNVKIFGVVKEQISQLVAQDDFAGVIELIK